MSVLLKQKKWVKWAVAAVLLLLVVIGTVHYLIVYRFKDVVQFIVSRESDNNYSFEAAQIKVSLFNKKIVVKKARLSCNDTSKTDHHYDISISEIYLSIQSWKELVLNQKLNIDSLAVIRPSIRSHDRRKIHTKSTSFQITDITRSLENILSHLQVHSFQLQNADIALHHAQAHAPFHSSNINLTIRNFLKREAHHSHFLSSDDVDLSITNQHWNLPDGLHEILFKKLHFSGKSQFFELDSCSFRSTENNPNKINISAEKIFFNSRDLTSLYDKNELLIDSLKIIRPIVDAQKIIRRGKKYDTTAALHHSVKQLLADLDFRYINIEDGRLRMFSAGKPDPDYETDFVNLKVFGLAVDKETEKLTTDSIELAQKNIRLVTKDSLFQMTIHEFVFRNNSLLLQNAEFKPTSINKSNKGITFSTPSLIIQNISLEDLMLKKLKGSHARLIMPAISMYKHNTKESLAAQGPKKTINDFYKTLHGLKEIISVDSFELVDGHMTYSSKGLHPLDMKMKQVNGLILLNSFFASDSLIDIKRSIPYLHIGETALHSPKLDIRLSNYHFLGGVRYNHADWFKLSLNNQTQLEGRQITWNILDWDLLERSKIIQMDHLNIQSLEVQHLSKETHRAAAAKKDLPVLHVLRIDIGRLHVASESPEQKIHFKASDLCMDEVNSVHRFLTWNVVLGQFRDIAISSKKMQATIRKAVINNEHFHVMEDASLQVHPQNGTTTIAVPRLTLQMPLQSTDFSHLHIASLEADHPEINVRHSASLQAASKKQGSSKGPLSLNADELKVKNGKLHYFSEKGNDTTSLDATVHFSARNIHVREGTDHLLQYDNALLQMNGLALHRKELDAAIPELTVQLTKGDMAKDIHQKIILHTALHAYVKKATIRHAKPDSTSILLDHLSAGYNNPDFTLSGKKISIESLLRHASVSEGAIAFHGRNITAKTGALEWNSEPGTFRLRDFSMVPNKSIEEVYRNAKYQTDYLTIEGRELKITGIHMAGKGGDSLYRFKKLMLDGISLNTTKDKGMAEDFSAEKPMLTQIAGKLKIPFFIDTLEVRNSRVTVNEISASTRKKGIIPLEDINARIINMTNRPAQADSLYLLGEVQLFSNFVREFNYTEAYNDSLSSFRLQLKASPMLLTEFSTITKPLASANIRKGESDTLFASWAGNKYAAAGKMNFYYEDLKVELLNKKDVSRKGFFLAIENMLANTFIKDKNRKSTAIFFERHRNKSVFNYWVKTKLSGVISSVVGLKDKSNRKKYRKLKQKYKLPEIKNI